jgi:hypothetical protein
MSTREGFIRSKILREMKIEEDRKLFQQLNNESI